MLKSKLTRSAAFYLEGANTNFPNAHLVTSDAFNKDLGIEHIGLRNPETVKPGAPIFRLSLMLDNGMVIYGDIFGNKDGKTMNVRYPQDTFAGADGMKQYVDKVSVPSAITAQILRHASTMVEVGAAPQQVVQQAPEQPVQQQVSQQVEQPTQQPVSAIEGLSNEELTALVASIQAVQ